MLGGPPQSRAEQSTHPNTHRARVVAGTLVHDVIGNEKAWKAWYDLECPEKEPMPMVR